MKRGKHQRLGVGSGLKIRDISLCKTELLIGTVHFQPGAILTPLRPLPGQQPHRDLCCLCSAPCRPSPPGHPEGSAGHLGGADVPLAGGALSEAHPSAI